MGAGADVAEDDGGTSSDRGDGKVDRESRSDENKRRVAPERVEVIASVSQFTELLPQLESVDRVAVDTEADSLHCYREKLCLLQVSLPGRDYIVDPLADVDLAPLCTALERKEIVLHGADFDLRLLRRGLNFMPQRIFDTVIGARLLGIRESGLLRGRAAAVLRALWQWREQEAKAADRPPFHILQNHELINAAIGFASEKLPDYRHFSSRRRQAFREAAQSALQLSEEEWPVWQRRFGTRPSAGMMVRTEELR